MALGSKQTRLGVTRNPKPLSKAFASGAKRKRSPLAYLIVAIVIIIVAIGSYLLVAGNSSSEYSLTSNKTLSMALNQTILLSHSGSSQPIAVQLANKSGSSYTFLVTATPVLANPIYTFTLSTGQVINISSSGGTTADLQIKLVSASNTMAVVEFVPIPASFNIHASTLATVGTSAEPTSTVMPSVTTQATTTISSGPTTQPTTTAAQGNSGPFSTAQVMTAANVTTYGTLMADMKALYNRDSACTSPQYNTTYYVVFHANATAPNNYANQSQLTPYNITYKVSYVSGDAYFVNYSTVSHRPVTSGLALSLELNAQTTQVINASFEGMFKGQSYSTVSSTYTTQTGINGDCGALLP